MGERQDTLFPPEFNRSLVLERSESALSGDMGAVLLRELGERSGLWRLMSDALRDARSQEHVTHPFKELLATAVLLPAQGWSAMRDVEYLREDPVLRLAVSERKSDRPLRKRLKAREPEGLPSQPTMSRLIEALGSAENLAALGRVKRGWAEGRVGREQRFPLEEALLDLDSLPIPVHGHQQGSAYNGHYRERCFHPLVISWEYGDILGALLRPGNVYTSADARDFTIPHVDWALGLAKCVWLRADAGFPAEGFLSDLEVRQCRYVMRLKSNKVLEEMAAPHVDRMLASEAPGTGEVLSFVELSYQAKSSKEPWSRERRVVLVLIRTPGDCMGRWFFLVTNTTAAEVPAADLLARYRKRGAMEKDFGDWMNALDVSLSSTNRPKPSYRGRHVAPTTTPPRDSFAVNHALLLVKLIAANLLHAGRVIARRIKRVLWSRETFRQLVLKCCARVTRSGRRPRVRMDAQRFDLWKRLWHELDLLYPRGSPCPATLPAA